MLNPRRAVASWTSSLRRRTPPPEAPMPWPGGSTPKDTPDAEGKPRPSRCRFDSEDLRPAEGSRTAGVTREIALRVLAAECGGGGRDHPRRSSHEHGLPASFDLLGDGLRDGPPRRDQSRLPDRQQRRRSHDLCADRALSRRDPSRYFTPVFPARRVGSRAHRDGATPHEPLPAPGGSRDGCSKGEALATSAYTTHDAFGPKAAGKLLRHIKDLFPSNGAITVGRSFQVRQAVSGEPRLDDL